MSEFQPVSSKSELLLLDDEDVLLGYRSGLRGDSEPGSAHSRSFWHGWRNGRADSGGAEIDAAQRSLARDVVGRHMKMH